MPVETVKNRFAEEFEDKPLMVASPGRINLIGEHTDYNHGFVMPAAIDKRIVAALAPAPDGRSRLVAFDQNDTHRFDVDDFGPSGKAWPDYILGVVRQLQRLGLRIGGFNAVFAGTIPAGAGLSSSAALECAFAYGLSVLFGYSLDRSTIAHLAQRAENEFVGVRCGIMDPFASVHGRAGSVFRLDCRSLEYEYFDFPMTGYRLILCDTGVKHHLASSEYNTRRGECEAGVAVLREHDAGIAGLRDVSLEQLQQHRSRLDPVIYRRCRYVIEENERVLAMSEALNRADPAGAGALLFQSHEGLSRDYEVSCEELDFLVECARADPGVAGARMMGGGFGGCTINLVRADRVDEWCAGAKAAYRERFAAELKIYPVQIADGTRIL